MGIDAGKFSGTAAFLGDSLKGGAQADIKPAVEKLIGQGRDAAHQTMGELDELVEGGHSDADLDAFVSAHGACVVDNSGRKTLNEIRKVFINLS